MHHDAVRIEHGYHLIDTRAWVRQRTGDPLPELTDAVAEFTRHPVFADYHRQLDTSDRMQLWCAARGWTTSAETSYYHDHTALTEPVRIVLAVDADRAAYALVQIGDDAPAVFLDVTTDDASWLQVEPVDIACPGGHRWTWLNHTALLDQDGTHIRFRDLFSRRPGAPYAECRGCLAYDNGDRDDPCPCQSRYTISCPTCEQRCRLELTDVPTFPARVRS
ncbi:hypothetical protein [Dactylosporangium darangshiense]|uniref:Uncharacterized protein n=1 Tax=Dactylosporangium darangshiense TaxID=579108 RepID=A0ABP8DSG0_9ACTN